MDILLLYFALPIATIILAAVLEVVLRRPVLVAAVFFAAYLIVAFVAFDETFLVNVIIYTILAYVTAVLICMIYRVNRTLLKDERSYYQYSINCPNYQEYQTYRYYQENQEDVYRIRNNESNTVVISDNNTRYRRRCRR